MLKCNTPRPNHEWPYIKGSCENPRLWCFMRDHVYVENLQPDYTFERPMMYDPAALLMCDHVL